MKNATIREKGLMAGSGLQWPEGLKIIREFYTKALVLGFLQTNLSDIEEYVTEHTYKKIIFCVENTEEDFDTFLNLSKINCISDILTVFYRNKLHTDLVAVVSDPINQDIPLMRNLACHVLVNASDSNKLNMYKLKHPELYHKYFK